MKINKNIRLLLMMAISAFIAYGEVYFRRFYWSKYPPEDLTIVAIKGTPIFLVLIILIIYNPFKEKK